MIETGLGSKKRRQSHKAAAMDSEARLAEAVGGQTQPGSGAGRLHKGDVKTADTLFDLKETSTNTHVVTVGMVGKISHEAAGAGRNPALVLQFNGKMPLSTPRSWVVIPLERYNEIIAESKRAEEPANGSY